MPRSVRMASSGFRRPDFEVCPTLRRGSPVAVGVPHKNVANEIVITLGTRNDWSIQAVKDLPIFQPSLNQKLEGRRIICVVLSILFRQSNFQLGARGYSYSDP